MRVIGSNHLENTREGILTIHGRDTREPILPLAIEPIFQEHFVLSRNHLVILGQ